MPTLENIIAKLVTTLKRTIATAVLMSSISLQEIRSQTPTPPQQDLPPSRLVVQSMRGRFPGNWEICTIDLQKKTLANLTNHPADDNHPSWSSNGKQIAFDSLRDADLDIFVMNADGTHVKNLTNHPANDIRPSWSPDGTKIAFLSTRDDTKSLNFWNVYVMNPDGSNVKNLTNRAAYYSSLMWSPDGKQLAFETNRDGNDEIYTVNVDGSGLKNLTNSSKREQDPHWSRLGEIAYTRLHGKNWDIHTMTSTGTRDKNITNHPGDDTRLVWSPDGTSIAFISERDINEKDPPETALYVMNADGKALTKLARIPFSTTPTPAWSPDGKFLVYLGGRGMFDTSLYLIDAEGKQAPQLISNGKYVEFSWEPQ